MRKGYPSGKGRGVLDIEATGVGIPEPHRMNGEFSHIQVSVKPDQWHVETPESLWLASDLADPRLEG
jgi:hypothetical protein